MFKYRNNRPTDVYSLVVSVSECLYLCEFEGAVGGE